MFSHVVDQTLGDAAIDAIEFYLMNTEYVSHDRDGR